MKHNCKRLAHSRWHSGRKSCSCSQGVITTALSYGFTMNLSSLWRLIALTIWQWQGKTSIDGEKGHKRGLYPTFNKLAVWCSCGVPGAVSKSWIDVWTRYYNTISDFWRMETLKYCFYVMTVLIVVVVRHIWFCGRVIIKRLVCAHTQYSAHMHTKSVITSRSVGASRMLATLVWV